jgi:hypothetical protein
MIVIATLVLDVPVVTLIRTLLTGSEAKETNALDDIAELPELNHVIAPVDGASKLYSMLYVWTAAPLLEGAEGAEGEAEIRRLVGEGMAMVLAMVSPLAALLCQLGDVLAPGF